MAKRRVVDTRFWDDSYIAQLSPNAKLLFLYLLTNPLTNCGGVYEIAVKRIVLDTGFTAREVSAQLDRLESDEKIVRRGNWIGIVNFTRYQTLNPSVRQGIAASWANAPAEIIEKLRMPATAQALLPASHRLVRGSDRLLDLTKTKKNLNLNGAARDGAALNQATPKGENQPGAVSLSEWLRRRRWPNDDEPWRGRGSDGDSQGR